MQPLTSETSTSATTSRRTDELFREQQRNIIRHTDRLFVWLMIFQWVAGVAAALWISPRTWAGTISRTHVHVWAALFLGGAITSFPVLLALTRPGKVSTRHAIGVGQMLMSALLIHLTGGRIETHFHVFGSLAILAFYRDWRVLISASLVVYADHLLRGFFWPQSVYGVLSAPVWRSFEHAGWVLFEVTFLIISIHKSLEEMRSVAERQAKLEALKESIEQTVAERTAELTKENLERRQTEERLRKSQAQLGQAQQIAHLGSWEWDIVEDKVTWSDEIYRLYGHQPQDFGARMNKCLERIHPDDRARCVQALEEARRTCQSFENDHRVVLPDGTERMMHGRGEVVLNERGEPIKMVGTAQDITDAKRAEEALRHSEDKLRQSQRMEAIGRLAGGVAHDFNNLLTVISGYCDLLIGQPKLDEATHGCIEEVRKAAERAAALTRQLLAFSRKQVLQPKVLDLNEVVAGMEKMTRRMIGEDVELRTSLKKPLGRIKADPGQIEQVVMNLVVNARDAMPRGGRILIETGNVSLDQKNAPVNREIAPGRYIMLAVTDTGVGMTSAVKEHLFEPFFTTKGPGKGTGLGLATSYGIIKQSGGDIRVYSEPDHGTTFKIYLPCVDELAATEQAPKIETSLPKGSEAILLVEDEQSVRGLTARILRSCGYIVYEAEDGVAGLHLARGEHSPKFDLIIADVIMPRMGGKEMVENLKLNHPELRVLFTSGYTDNALDEDGVLSPGVTLLEKPFSPARLAHKVREVLDQPSACLV